MPTFTKITGESEEHQFYRKKKMEYNKEKYKKQLFKQAELLVNKRY